MEIKKVHILPRHFCNMKDYSAGIFFTEVDEGINWLWRVIAETVNLFICDCIKLTFPSNLFFANRALQVLSISLINGARMPSKRSHVSKKWSKVSSPFPQRRHIGFSWDLLNEALFACKMYVPVAILRRIGILI